MKQLLFALFGFATTHLSVALSLGGNGTFLDPAARLRPRFRYWLPDASVDGEVVAQNIKSVADIGGGGVEFLPYFEYGGFITVGAPTNWSTYGFGTAPFVDLLRTALDTHRKHGLVMDFALGPNQGQGVPAESDNEGLQWDLVPFTTHVPQSGRFQGVIPGWGTGRLVACVTALVKTNQTVTYETLDVTSQPTRITFDEYKLDHTTLTECTDSVDQNGRLTLQLRKATTKTHHRIFAFYERLSGEKNLLFASDRHQTLFDNGSYVVDHFDAKGAAIISGFWEEYMLTDEIAELLHQVGNYAWEDSLEMSFNVTWSRSIPDRFQKLHGYSIKPYLPLLTFQQNTIAMQAASPGKFQCTLDTTDGGLGYVNDYHATLAAGYKEYLATLAAWAHERFSAQLSVQPAYNSVMDMLAVIPTVDAPECESLGFVDNIDVYRAFSGPARLTGRRAVSNEMGAVSGSAYNYHLPQLLFAVNRAFLGGVNQMVLHGLVYTGSYPNTTWPGHTPFINLFSELWSPKLPVWNHGLKEVLDYISRVQYILQTNIPKADVAIYHKQSVTTLKPSYQADDLLDEGWSWNYVTSDNLQLDQAQVRNGLLAPEGPAWKALVVERSQNLTIDAVQALRKFSQNGLPIIFSGGRPGFYPTGSGESDKTRYERELSSLLGSKNVYSVNSSRVADKLRALGLRPRAGVSTNGTCYTTWAEGPAGVGYAVVYSDVVQSTGTVTVTSTQTPFYLNPWTGETSPVLIYTRTKDTTTIPVSLASNQTLYLAFSDAMHTSIPRYHVQAAPSHVLNAEPDASNKISLHVARSETHSTVLLSTGKRVPLDSTSTVPSTFRLMNWTLVAEHWEAPEDVYNVEETKKYNTTHQITEPISWTQIAGLANASGVGYYTTTFQWARSSSPASKPCRIQDGTEQRGAYLRFSRVIDSVSVAVNGQLLPPLDLTNAVADISRYLRAGQNTVQVIAPTTLRNYLRTIWDTLATAGFPASLLGGAPAQSEAGLVGDVTVVPYRIVTV